MSAEILRKAAALMRERAEAAWETSRWMRQQYVNDDRSTITLRRGEYFYVKTDCGTAANADHIASWHPAVALAVADWLESEAVAFDAHLAKQADPDCRFASIWTAAATARHEHALAVARAYVGSDA